MLNKASMALIRLVILCHGTRLPSFSNSPVYFSFLMQAFISPRLDKTIEKPLFQWLTPAKTIDSDGDKIPKPSLFHRWRKKEPSPFHRHENLTIVHVYSVSFRFSSIGGKVSVSSLDFLRLEKNFFFSS